MNICFLNATMIDKTVQVDFCHYGIYFDNNKQFNVDTVNQWYIKKVQKAPQK